jgi:hypothetical protein
MQNIQNMSAEELAKLFYGYRNMLASEFGFQSGEGIVSWEQIRPENRNLMVSSARLVLRDLAEGQFAAASRNMGLRESA